MFKKKQFKGRETGKNILILGAVHGDEIAGPLAQQEIIKAIENEDLVIQKGEITFIPIVNEQAHLNDTRFIDENLNRVIKHHENPITYEQKIANLLIDEIKKADVLLDLHSTHCPNDKPFAFIDHPTKQNLEFLKSIPVDVALAGWPEIYQHQPNIENNCTEEYAFLNGTDAITLECGFHKAPEAVQIAKQSILNTLAHFEIIKSEPLSVKEKNIITLKNFIIKEKEGALTKKYTHLDPVKKGEVVALYNDNQPLIAPFDGYIIMPNEKASIGAEWFYFGKNA